MIKTRAQRAHPFLNIVNPKAIQKMEKPVQQHGAFSPSPSKAPIAHMDSTEDDAATNSQGNTARGVQTESGSEQPTKLDLSFEPGLLFCSETVYDAIKASNKEAPRLLQVTVEFFFILNFLAI